MDRLADLGFFIFQLVVGTTPFFGGVARQFAAIDGKHFLSTHPSASQIKSTCPNSWAIALFDDEANSARVVKFD